MRTILGAFLCAAFLAVGCNSDVHRANLKGKVTLDDKPIEKGLVEFIPADGKTPSAKGGIIVNGEYSAEVVPGNVLVKITSPEVVGKRKMYDTPDSPLVDDVKERIPTKYNDETILKETIQSNQKELHFKLSSK